MFIFLLRIFPLFCLICTLFLGGCVLGGCEKLAGHESRQQAFHVYFLNVGQGDACLMQTRSNHFFLFDTGNDKEALLSFLRKRKVDTLSAVFISHPDLDHYGAFLPLLKEFPIKKMYMPPGTSQNPAWQELLGALDAFPGSKVTLLAGDTLIWDGEVNVRALWPYSRSSFQSNNLSLVLRVEYAQHALLLTGDVEDEGELGMLAADVNLDSDILKVAHHGSRTSNGLPFLSAVAPRWAIISCDSSVYGHPHRETMADLNLIMGDSTQILRTDREGTIGFAMDIQGVRRLRPEEVEVGF
jgi:competence protein ComEC